MKRKFTYLTLILGLCFLTFGNHATAQKNQGYIYGTVESKSGQEYTGYMRWGKEEMYWHDIFNSNKIEDSELFRGKPKDGKWYDFDWNFGSIWDNKYESSYHIFSCYFGDIDHLSIKSDSKVDLTFKNGQTLKLKGGSNDIGTSIYMEDNELGTIKIPWSKVKTVDFKALDRNHMNPYGEALYGTVYTKRKGSFTGYIKWDLDERHGYDILDGDSYEGDEKIPFSNIKSIEKHGNGAEIILKNGDEIYLDNSNDVDYGNRGIEIFQEGIGTVTVQWKAFKFIEFEDAPSGGPSYSEFTEPRGLEASVETYDDGTYAGLIVFDVDEMWEPEMLDGEDDYLKYQIPFRYIKTIAPKNNEFTIVGLRNGSELLLGGTQDVSDSNDGVLVISRTKKDPLLIDWDEIIEIRIK